MNKWLLEKVRNHLREFFVLEGAERQSMGVTSAQRTAVRAYTLAAHRRRQVARSLTEPAHRPVALGLYRESARLLALAYLASKTEDFDGSAASTDLPPATLVARLEAALQAHNVPVPAALARATALLASSDPLDPDRLSKDEVAAQIDDLERATAMLTSLLELRSPREIKTTRLLRQGAGGTAALALLTGLLITGFSAKNIARGKPASASSMLLDTTPGGAVDGTTSGKFGFHSALEERPWLSIDLGKSHSIERIAVFGRGDEHNAQSIPLALEASDDGTVFRQVALRTEPFSANAPWALSLEGQALTTRFVRLRTQRRAYLVLGEVEVFGKPK